MSVLEIFNINNIFITVWGYPLSYVEFIGTVFNIWCVWLAAKSKISTWPIGIVGVVFYISLFYQIQFYSDLIEQFYFLIMSFYGWWLWLKIGKQNESRKKGIRFNSRNENLATILLVVIGTLILTSITTRLNILFPQIFPLPASYPVLDALTTVMSFTAAILLAKKRVENWYLWILVDVIGIWLYYVKGVKFISLEYVLFLILASYGLFDWLRILEKKKALPAKTK